MPLPSTLLETTKVRIWVISDVHGLHPESGTIFRFPLPKCDILIIAGDLSEHGGLEEYEEILHWIKRCDAELKIVIAGNHDTSLDPDLDGGHRLVAAEALWTGREAEDAGIVYLKEETRMFALKNKDVQFKVHASPYQPWLPGADDWAFGYDRDEDRYNPQSNPLTEAAGIVPIPEGVDILITHGPPKGINDKLDKNEEHVGCQWLLRRLEKVKPMLHAFGHIHESFGATRVQWGEKDETGRGTSDDDDSPTGHHSEDNAPNTEGSTPIRDHITHKFVGTAIKLDPVPSESELKEKADVTDENASWNIDVSRDGERPLRMREETLCVNASLVDNYKNVRCGGVLIDMELPVVRR